MAHPRPNPSNFESEQTVGIAERGGSKLTATYSPEDDKLRLYTGCRVDQETFAYARLRAAGFSWFPEQQLFVATGWTPERADLLIEFCGGIGDEDKSLVRRGGERAERIQELEAKQREMQHRKSQAERFFKAWRKEGLTLREAKELNHFDPENFVDSPATKPGTSLWDVVRGFISPKPTAEQMAEKAILRHWKTVAWTNRWIQHYEHRLSYERAMLAADGGMVAQEEPKVSETSAIPSGIQTPRGPIPRSQSPVAKVLQMLSKPKLGQGRKPGMRL